jgi:hypothetical protein
LDCRKGSVISARGAAGEVLYSRVFAIGGAWPVPEGPDDATAFVDGAMGWVG